MSCLIHDGTIQKLADFKNMHEYTSSYQAVFEKVFGLLIYSSHYICKNLEIYFQATILIHIRTKYLAYISIIQKN